MSNERLTEITPRGIVGNNEKVSRYPLYAIADSDPLDHGIIGQCFAKLAAYESLEEKKLLLILPCQEGATVYAVENGYTTCSKQGRTFDEYSWYCQFCKGPCDSHAEFNIHTYHDVKFDWIIENINKFGKTMFLTMPEAERKLKEFSIKAEGEV